MSGYGQPAAPRAAAPGGQQQQTTQIVSYVAGALGVLMFVWGFLKWFTEGSGSEKEKLGGYALGSPGTAAIACVLAAGLLVLLHTMDNKPLGPLPLVLSATGLLVTLGIFIGKGSASPSGASPKLGAGIGLILALITALLQTGALAYLHFGLGSATQSGAATGAGTWQPSTGYGTPPVTGGYGQQPTSSPYGPVPPAGPGSSSPYGQYGQPQQQPPPPQQPRPPAPSYGQPGASQPPHQPAHQPQPTQPQQPSQQPTQHLPAGPPPPSGPPAGGQPPAPSGPPPGQYGPPSQYGQPGQPGQPGQNPQNPYGPPQQR